MINNKSFTLIEILVAVTIFSLVVAAGSGIFISSISGQQKSLAFQKVLSESSYVMEYVSRSLRMAQKDDIEINGVTKNCLSGDKVNYEITPSGKGIKFRNYKNECQEFYLDTSAKQLKESKDEVENYLTSEKLEVLAFNINLLGQSQEDSKQPRVTIFLDIKTRGQRAQTQYEMKIQTTISQRNLDVKR